MTSSRLPVPGQDNGTWGDILNSFLEVSHASDGTLNSGVVGVSQLQDGAITVAKLHATGTASGSTYLRGDGSWSTPAAGVQLDATASDIQPLGSQAAGSTGKAADAGHIHAMPRLDQVGNPTANVNLNSQKITGLANGSSSTDAAAYGQLTALSTVYAPISGSIHYPDKSYMRLNAHDYGVKCDGSTDDYAATMAAFAAASALVKFNQLTAASDSSTYPVCAIIEFPEGTLCTGTAILVPQGVSIYAPQTRFKATASMTTLIYTDPAVVHQGEALVIGWIDCNGLAQNGHQYAYQIGCSFQIGEIFNPTQYGYIAGSTSAASNSYGAHYDVRKIWRPRNATVTASIPAIWVQNCTDSTYGGNTEIRGFDWGTRNDSGNNLFMGIHPYNPSGATGITKGFYENSSSARYIGCTADGPTQYGWHLGTSAFMTVVTGMNCYLNAANTDNVATAFRHDNTGNPDLTVVGGVIYGSGGIRWAKDFDFAGGLTNVRVRGVSSESSYVVTRYRGGKDFGGGLTVQRGSQTLASAGAVTIDAASGDYQHVNCNAATSSSTITGGVSGQRLTVEVFYGASGTWLWPASGVKYAGGSAPTPSNTSTWTDRLLLESDGSTWYEVSRSIGIR